MFAQALVYAAIGVTGVIMGIANLAAVPNHHPGPCEAGRLGLAGLALSFLCGGVTLLRPSACDVVAAVRGRQGGEVRFEGARLVIDHPGCSARPPCSTGPGSAIFGGATQLSPLLCAALSAPLRISNSPSPSVMSRLSSTARSSSRTSRTSRESSKGSRRSSPRPDPTRGSGGRAGGARSVRCVCGNWLLEADQSETSPLPAPVPRSSHRLIAVLSPLAVAAAGVPGQRRPHGYCTHEAT